MDHCDIDKYGQQHACVYVYMYVLYIYTYIYINTLQREREREVRLLPLWGLYKS